MKKVLKKSEEGRNLMESFRRLFLSKSETFQALVIGGEKAIKSMLLSEDIESLELLSKSIGKSNFKTVCRISIDYRFSWRLIYSLNLYKSVIFLINYGFYDSDFFNVAYSFVDVNRKAKLIRSFDDLFAKIEEHSRIESIKGNFKELVDKAWSPKNPKYNEFKNKALIKSINHRKIKRNDR